MRPKKQAGTGLLLPFLSLQLLFIGVVDAKVRLNESNGGGFTDLVVALPTFTNDVRIVQSLVTNLETLLTNASKALHRATHGRLFFEEVTVLVPTVGSYNGSDDDDLYGGPIREAGSDETYDLADIRVSGHLSSVYAASDLLPHTVQRGDCGEPGEFIVLTAGYLALFGNESFTGHYGDPSKAFVAQWARYRYGVFGENDRTHFYYHPERQMFEAAQCANGAIIGWVLDSESGFLCSADRHVSMPSKQCRFFHGTLGNDHLTSSLLFDTKLPHVTEFCNETTHNRYAPTMQNRRCNGRSAWEVMREHSDFDRNIDVGAVEFLPPRFRFVKSDRNASIAVLLDLSVLSSSWSPALVSLRKYIMFAVPEGTTLELCFVNSTVQLLSFRMTIRDSSDRETFFNYIDLVVTTNSSAELLHPDPSEGEFRKWQSGVVICIVSSGNVMLGNWTGRLDGAHFVPIFLNVPPQDHLVEIANGTGGTVYALVGSHFHLESDLDSVLLEVSDRFTDAFDIVPIANGVLKSRGNIPDRFLVDASVVGHLRVVVSVVSSLIHQDSSRLAGLAFFPDEASVLVSPAAIYSRKSFQPISMDTLTRSQTLAEFKLENAQPGLWSLRRAEQYDPDNCVVVFQVFAVLPGRNSMRSKPGIKARAQLDRTTIEEESSIPRLTVSLMHGDNVYASGRVMTNVTARIYPPHNKRNFLKALNDEGKGADVIAGDGVYSAFMTHIVSDGTYRVVPLVYGGDAISCLLGRSPDCFQRSPSPLYFEVKPFSWNLTLSENDWMPPNTIRDLSLVSTKSDVFHADVTIATLEFTSPGDDYDDGLASGYDMRYFHDWSAAQNFTVGKRVTVEMIYRGDLSNPKPAGYREVVSVRFPRLGDSFDVNSSVIFLSVQAYDDAGNYGDTSNVVSIPVSSWTSSWNASSSTSTPATTSTSTPETTSTSTPETTPTSTPEATSTSTSEGTTTLLTTDLETTTMSTQPTTNSTSDSVTDSQLDTVTDYVVNVTDPPSILQNDTIDANATIVFVVPTSPDKNVGSIGRNKVNHAHDGVVASAILLFVALTILFACFIHIRFYSRRSKQNRFAYEEFQVGERVASRIEH